MMVDFSGQTALKMFEMSNEMKEGRLYYAQKPRV